MGEKNCVISKKKDLTFFTEYRVLKGEPWSLLINPYCNQNIDIEMIHETADELEVPHKS